MLKLRSIFVTSLLTGLVVTSNFGCGGSGGSTTDASDARTDTHDAVSSDVKVDTGGTGGATTDAKDALDAVDVPKDTVDAADATDAKDATDAGDVSDAGDAKDATDATDAEVTTPVCTSPCTLGAHQCGTNGGVQTCATNASGCPVFGAEVACGGHQACSGGVCGCVAPSDTGCTAAGTFCATDGSLKTCAVDGSCKFVSATTACATDTQCTGTLPSAACTCNNQCATVGNFCSDAKTAAVCANDGNSPACRTITGTTACGSIKNCVGGACICPAAGGTHENEGCVRGTDANICDTTHILTCVHDSDSNCDIWKVAPGGLCESDNGGGLTCGSKAGHAACQCPARTGGDVFADPAGGTSDTGGVFATGIQSPAQCRLPTLTKGLGVAASTAGVTRVVAIADAPPAAFNAEPSFPLNVPAGVLLTTADATPTPANYKVNFNSATNIAVLLADKSEIQGFTLQNVSGSASGVMVNALPSAQVTLDNVVIDAHGTTSTLTDGILINSNSSATLNAVTVGGAAVAALAANTSATVGVTGGTFTGSKFGVDVQLGAVTMTNATISANQTGIQLETGAAPSLHLVGGTVTGNTVGAVISKGALLADTGATFTLSTGDGITISSGSANLHGVDINNNGGDGLAASGAGTVVVIDQGSHVNGNGTAVAGNGIVGGAGTLLTVDGSTEVASNTGNGIMLLGALTNISAVSIHTNTMNGVDINSDGTVVNIGNSTPATMLITNNTLNGILVEAALKTGSDANSVTLDGVTAATNGGSGIYVAGTAGIASVTIKGSTINGNGDTGVLVEEHGANKTTTVFQSNDVFGNATTSTTHTVGGILFNSSSTLPTFVGNKVHSNVGDELGFTNVPDLPATKWIISPPSAACDATANSLYCHGDGNVGLRVSGASLVDASWVHWSNLPPAGNVDYSPFIAPPAPAQVDVSNACAVVACP
ncbi:MAG TPA: right-handed parallel beta-helix repeat-containing protein [Polyangia bacterium]|nr:right-handed parallel beta-helix repeat-containing protein [Polyangia bacterium]